MTKDESQEGLLTTSDLTGDYRRAEPHSEGKTEMTFHSQEAIEIPLSNTVFATSGMPQREVTVRPIQIQKSLESLQRNEELQSKGLG